MASSGAPPRAPSRSWGRAPGQSARGTRQCTTVRNCQMSRWRPGSLARVVDARQRAPHSGHATAAPGALPTRMCSSSSPGLGRLEPHVLDPPLGPQAHRALEEPRQHPGLARPCGHLPSPPDDRMVPLGVTRSTRGLGALPTKSSEEPKFRQLETFPRASKCRNFAEFVGRGEKSGRGEKGERSRARAPRPAP